MWRRSNCAVCNCSGRDCLCQTGGGSLHGFGRDAEDEAACADGDSAFDHKLAQSVDGAADPFLRGIVARAESLPDFAQGFILKITEQES